MHCVASTVPYLLASIVGLLQSESRYCAGVSLHVGLLQCRRSILISLKIAADKYVPDTPRSQKVAHLSNPLVSKQFNAVVPKPFFSRLLAHCCKYSRNNYKLSK
jgi:hypothetical protein